MAAALTRRRVAEELLTTIRIGSLRATASAHSAWREDIFRGFRPNTISRSVALKRTRLFATNPGYLQQLLEVYLGDLSIRGSLEERIESAAGDARIPEALRDVFTGLASTDLSSVPSGFDGDDPKPPSPDPEAARVASDSTLGPKAPVAQDVPTEVLSPHKPSFSKEPFDWTPPDDDTGVVQDAVTLFERSLSAFVEDRLRATHGDAWLRRGCGGDYKKRWAEKEERATGPRPASLLGYAEIAELSEIIRRKANWDAFEPYFNSKSSLEQDFSQVLPLRNAAFHSGQRVLYAAEEAAAFAAMARIANSYHSPTATSIDNLWKPDRPEPRPEPTRNLQDTDITANRTLKNFEELLPSQSLVGRENQLRDVHEFWHDPFARSLSVTGRGGLGKTALVYEFVNDLLRLPVPPGNETALELVLFLTAKQSWAEQDNQERLPESQRFGTLREAFFATLDLFEVSTDIDADFGTLRRQVLEIAQDSPCLFVFDNLETLADEEIASVANFCRDLPSPSKAIVTDRERRGFGVGHPLPLPPLSLDASLSLIDSRLALEDVQLSAETRPALTRVVGEIGGVPLYLHYVANLLGQGYPPQEALDRLRGEDTLGLLKFSFESSLDRLSQVALQLLFYIAVKKDPATRKALRRLCSDDSQLDDGLDELKGAHFIETAPGREAAHFQIADGNLRDYVSLEAPKRLGEDVARDLIKTAGTREAFVDHPNVRRAIDQAIREADSLSWEGGIAYLEDRRAEFRNAPQILAKLGYLHFRCHDRQRARDLLERSLAGNWEDAVTLRTLGIINLWDNRLEEAEENASAALTLRPEDRLTKILLGEVILTRAERYRFTLDRGRRVELAKRASQLIDESLIEDDYRPWQQGHNERRLRLLDRCETVLTEASTD